MANSYGFNKLHQDVQKWIWQQKWSELRDIQEQAIEPILAGNCDVVISASTASGKTEAAFLPACSAITTTVKQGIGILYISPLKALINDQHRRLEGLYELLNMPVTPWHGDVLRSVKDKQQKNPQGIILITPESLESLLLNKSSWCIKAFKQLSYIVIDEFHAFLGTERGCQLQSLMHRLEFLLKRNIPRIALSATLGDMDNIAKYLRPNEDFPYHIIKSTTSQSDLKILLKGYIKPAKQNADTSSVLADIVGDLYTTLRGKSNLIFANSRKRTEEIATALTEKCDKDNVPNEFFPHHGSLSKEIRQTLEARLQQQKCPTSAVCTMTLELGIDIGNVDSVAQVTSPHSVSSLRQRLGRSGRRNQAAVLRLFIAEDEITDKSHIIDRLRLETIQSIAMVNLLLKKWYEPASVGHYHFSTLVQQTLSVIAQYGSVRADQLYTLLCKTGVFKAVDQQLYANFLREIAGKDLITQMHDGLLVLGESGERLVGHYSFYTAFQTPEEYRLEHNGRVIGTIPVDNPLLPEQSVIFAGKRWQVLHIDSDNKLIALKPSVGGKPPEFSGGTGIINNAVRQEMFSILKHNNMPVYLDATAKELFTESTVYFNEYELANTSVLEIGDDLHILTWLGDKIINTLAILLMTKGLTADHFAGVIDIKKCSLDHFHDVVADILSEPKPSPQEIASKVPDTITEKHDHLLSKPFRDLGYAAKYFDIDGTWNWLKSYANSKINY